MNATEATISGVQQVQGALSILTALQMTAHLWPKNANVEDGAKFDFIVVGGGTAGSVIANRLTEIKKVTVLLKEAGGDPPLESVVPGLFPYLKNTSVDWDHASVDDGYSQQFHPKHGAEVTKGKMLGGSSSINFMLYTRGNFHDFDNWAKITGDESWNWKHVLPYFKKSERLVDPVLLNSDAVAYHGTDGYLGTTRNYDDEVKKYFEAYKEIGHEIRLDVNGNTPLGITECMFTIADSVRQSTAQAFLHPIKNRPNLFVLKNTLVSRVIFDKNRNAIGVEAILENNKTVTFKAIKEVVVSAGSINSPQLLMLSGVGPKKHLNKHNIDVISDLPVGQTLQDHIFGMMTHPMGKAGPVKPADFSNFPTPLIIGYTSLNKTQNYPDYQIVSFIMNEPTPMMLVCAYYFTYIHEVCQEYYNKTIGKEIMYSTVTLIYPESRGKVLLRSKDPRDKPIIHTGYYSNDIDLDRHALYIADFLRIQETKLFKSVKSEVIVPEVCGCSKIKKGTHAYWRCFALCAMVEGYHHVGSCPMGDVVDSRLKVFGVKRLRVADASVMPKITGANTNAATIMIGEKAADIIKEDHNLQTKPKCTN